MKASQKSTLRNLVAMTILALGLSLSAYAGNTASGTVRLGVVLVSTIEAQPQTAAQVVQFSMGGGVTLRMDAANPSVNGQVREIELAIGPAAGKAGQAAPVSTNAPPQASAKLIQTTFVAD